MVAFFLTKMTPMCTKNRICLMLLQLHTSTLIDYYGVTLV